jgi:polyhydroxyalkanoate synthesis regulator phasin
MADFSNLVQKAFYLGVGLASYAGEKASDTLGDLRSQAQKLLDELVERGEMTAEEAQRRVNEMMNQAQAAGTAATSGSSSTPEQPRRIEIVDDTPGSAATVSPEQQQADELRRQVEALRDELRRLKDN